MRSLAAGVLPWSLLGREQCVAVAGMLPSVCSGLPLRPMSKACLKAHWLVEMAGVRLPASVLTADEGQEIMSVGLDTGEPVRRRVYFAEWRFKIGATVHSKEMCAIVLSRHRTAQGRQLYQVWVTGKSYGRPYRWMLGTALS